MKQKIGTRTASRSQAGAGVIRTLEPVHAVHSARAPSDELGHQNAPIHPRDVASNLRCTVHRCTGFSWIQGLLTGFSWIQGLLVTPGVAENSQMPVTATVQHAFDALWSVCIP